MMSEVRSPFSELLERFHALTERRGILEDNQERVVNERSDTEDMARLLTAMEQKNDERLVLIEAEEARLIDEESAINKSLRDLAEDLEAAREAIKENREEEDLQLEGLEHEITAELPPSPSSKE
jgi:hypothetical protein